MIKSPVFQVRFIQGLLRILDLRFPTPRPHHLNLVVAFCLFLITSGTNQCIQAQEEAFGFGFNYFEREWIDNDATGAGYSFYAGVWPIMQQYPGPNNFQLGLPSTWLTPLTDGSEPGNFYNTIEGGLGWWGDSRFATETPKFIMGGVAFDFNQWANGTGAGSGPLRDDGHRDWNEDGGKYGVAQLSPNLLWPPDGLNMEQGANGEFLGYGYHPLPLTDPLEQTRGEDFATGNQCWTLFLNTKNFKGPATFFIPTFWTETVVNDPSLEGLFLDSRSTDKNIAFAIEYAESPALIATDDAQGTYARILPLVYPKSSANRSELIREIKIHTKNAKWDAVESWFNGGPVAPTQFSLTETADIRFVVGPEIDGYINQSGNDEDFRINFDPFAEKIMSPDQLTAGFEWDTNVVTETADNFIMPEFYQLNDDNLWNPIAPTAVPASTGLLDNLPTITPRPDNTPYLTPIEPDCHLQDPLSPWNSPGPVAGPFLAQLGDGSVLTYYWYRFIDQPSIIHANLPETIRQNLQERVEKIHTHWSSSDEYLPAPMGGGLVGLDQGLMVTPPIGMEIGYVPIVTRQEKGEISSSSNFVEEISNISVSPNPTNGLLKLKSTNEPISSFRILNAQGQVIVTRSSLNQLQLILNISQQPPGIYLLSVTNHVGITSTLRLLKSE